MVGAFDLRYLESTGGRGRDKIIIGGGEISERGYTGLVTGR